MLQAVVESIAECAQLAHEERAFVLCRLVAGLGLVEEDEHLQEEVIDLVADCGIICEPL